MSSPRDRIFGLVKTDFKSEKRCNKPEDNIIPAALIKF
jgi:hypothetical protein